MFRENKRHLQPPLISPLNDLSAKQRSRLEESWAGTFYREFFCRIDEEVLRVLYAEVPSRPNVPVNVLLGLEVLKAAFGWSDEEMYDHFNYDVQVRFAVGLQRLGECEFDLRTIYNFRQRLSSYNQEHGTNLLVTVFRQITDEHLEAFKLQTGQQRMDSSQIASNILQVSRLRLLVEALQRVDRLLSAAEHAQYADLLEPYRQGSSGQYVYRIKGLAATEQHLQDIGLAMYRLIAELPATYHASPAYQVLCRIFDENFQVELEQVQLRPKEQLGSGCLQSVDDVTATFRRKGRQGYKGYVFNVTETCDPTNPLQLITEVQVAPNNVDDATLLIESLPGLKQRTDLHTLYTDGGYGSPAADEILQVSHVAQVQTALRGNAPDPHKFSLADYTIERADDGTPRRITCPYGQQVVAGAGRTTGYVARFDPAVCQTCPHAVAQRCRAQPGKRDPCFSLRFTRQEVNWAVRRQRSRANRKQDKNLRAAVEATVREIKHPFPAGKLPVRGQFRVTCLVVGSAAMANIRRLTRYLGLTPPEPPQKVTASGQKEGQKQLQHSFLSSVLAFGRRLLRPPVTVKACFGC